MKNKLVESLLDSIKSVMPIVIVITIISLVINVPLIVIISFIISSILLIIGITFFTTGADMAMITIGEEVGREIVKTRKKVFILLISFIMGMVITISEPDLTVFSRELSTIPNMLIITMVSVGVGIYLMIGVFRILKKISYRRIIMFSLLIILCLLYFTQQEFISIAFDGGGVTTGAMGVPLIVAFGYGITKYRSDSDAKGDSFGLCGLCSLGPVIVILILGLFFNTDCYFDTSHFVSKMSLLSRFGNNLISSFRDVIISVLPIICVFIIMRLFNKKLSVNRIVHIIFGMLLSIVGLTLFLTGVSFGFMEMGYRIGSVVTSSAYRYLLIPIGMIIGYVIINAEPAVKILNKEISDLTEGSISKKVINLCLSFGVCLAILLSLLRVFYNIPMLYIIVPGYFLAGMLTYFTPKMFMTIAFDSGGAASGSMTTSFLLPICIGACEVLGGDILSYAFGVGALVSLSPIITIQLLGVIYKHKFMKKDNHIFDETIVEYAWEA